MAISFKQMYIKHVINFEYTLFSIPVDSTPPVVTSCPLDIALQKVNHATLKVMWEPPSATDLSGYVTLISQNHLPGDEFDFGMHNVTYAFADDSGNIAYCLFRISVVESKDKNRDILMTPHFFFTNYRNLKCDLLHCEK